MILQIIINKNTKIHTLFIKKIIAKNVSNYIFIDKNDLSFYIDE